MKPITCLCNNSLALPLRVLGLVLNSLGKVIYSGRDFINLNIPFSKRSL